MAGSKVPGSLCSTTAPEVDLGTNALARSPTPGSVCVFHGTPVRKASKAKSGRESAKALAIEKARGEAINMLATRLKDLDTWDAEIAGRGVDPALDTPLSPACGLTARQFIGWFGTSDAAARSKIRKRILKAIEKLKSLRVGDFLSDPKDSSYAYVYPRSIERGRYEHTVHLGKAFWNDTEDKTRAGTLIHEVSHFVSVGGTDDVGTKRRDREAVDFPGKSPTKYGSPKSSSSYAAYGGARAARLAISHPALALENADSFEFFIEGRTPSVILDEKGNLDTEGFGDFPNIRGNRG